MNTDRHTHTHTRTHIISPSNHVIKISINKHVTAWKPTCTQKQTHTYTHTHPHTDTHSHTQFAIHLIILTQLYSRVEESGWVGGKTMRDNRL